MDKKVIAQAYLIDSDNQYKPGDQITEGYLYDQAEYYAGIGKVRIEPDPEPDPELPTTEDGLASLVLDTPVVTYDPDEAKNLGQKILGRRGRPKKG
jgi:hypothetical protein